MPYDKILFGYLYRNMAFLRILNEDNCLSMISNVIKNDQVYYIVGYLSIALYIELVELFLLIFEILSINSNKI